MEAAMKLSPSSTLTFPVAASLLDRGIRSLRSQPALVALAVLSVTALAASTAFAAPPPISCEDCSACTSCETLCMLNPGDYSTCGGQTLACTYLPLCEQACPVGTSCGAACADQSNNCEASTCGGYAPSQSTCMPGPTPTPTPESTPEPGALTESIEFYHQDALGSVRLVTDEAGAVVSRHDYLPFGEEIPEVGYGRDGIPGYGPSEDLRHRFTGKERDQESGLDYFGARYYSSAQGRFASADPKMTVDPTVRDPRRWNRYAYALNSPFRYIDPDGQEATVVLINGAGYSRQQSNRIAAQTAAVLVRAGLKNVTVEVTDNASATGRANRHTVIGELGPGRKHTAVGIDTGGDPGLHAGYSHKFAIDTKAANPVPGGLGGRSADEREATAIGNFAAHEFSHESNSNSNIWRIATDGLHDATGLFQAEPLTEAYDPDASISAGRAKVLQQQFNRPDEVDQGVRIDTGSVR
jgi:RHS repeat-associated protein